MSMLIVVLMVTSSAGGLLIDGLYQDPDSVSAMLRGYDLITLVLAAPLLTVALLPSLRESPRAQLLWLSILSYAVYDYALYVFGTTFNAMLLVHVALFSLSVFTLVLALASLEVSFHARVPVRLISAVLLILGVALGAMWVFYSLRFTFTGQVPEEASRLVLPTASTHLGYVLDLSLLVPGYVLAAVLLWRRAAWGYLLATILLVSGALHQIAYMTALVCQAGAQIPGAPGFDPAEAPIAAAFLAAAALLLYDPVARSDSPRTPSQVSPHHHHAQ
jgi:hypothetical protein